VHCDGIVATVFARIQSGSNRDTGGVICFPHGSLS
jgi:hypothetical protein